MRYPIGTLRYKTFFIVLWFLGAVTSVYVIFAPVSAVSYRAPIIPVAPADVVLVAAVGARESVPSPLATPHPSEMTVASNTKDTLQIHLEEVVTARPYHAVPFYSQFTDITSPRWQKVGCGIASAAMLIDFYSTDVINVDALLEQGIKAQAYLENAGWTHQGLIDLMKPFGLVGESRSIAHLTMEAAFTELREVVTGGPVMVSVHYTFQPSNPIPHLAVVTGIDDERVYYNDPADLTGEHSISIAQFKSAWKKRYIAVLPTA